MRVGLINSLAPIRVCDNGGWTDTWFAKHGMVFNIAVYPYAQVQLKVIECGAGDGRVTIHAENYGERYDVPRKPRRCYDKHPLLEAAFDFMEVPEGVCVEATIHSEAPAGCSTGTSAAVSVALVGALDCLTPGRMTPHEVAMTAHRIETELLGQECGVQDQLAAAYGGINLIEIDAFPRATVRPLHVPDDLWWELERRLVLVFVGEPHSSSAIHKLVIADLGGCGHDSSKLNALRSLAARSREAIEAAELAALGRAMIENTDAQGDLHPALVGRAHQRVIDIARAFGAIGWKVNGAGGDGGSVTLLAPPGAAAKRAMIGAIEQSDPCFRHIQTYLSRRGLRRWESQDPRDNPHDARRIHNAAEEPLAAAP